MAARTPAGKADMERLSVCIPRPSKVIAFLLFPGLFLFVVLSVCPYTSLPACPTFFPCFFFFSFFLSCCCSSSSSSLCFVLFGFFVF